MNGIEKFLMISGITEVKKKTEEGAPYRTVYVKPAITTGAITVTSIEKPFTRNVFGNFTDKNGKKHEAETIFLEIESGEKKLGSCFFGEIMTFQTTGYPIEGRTVIPWSTVILPREKSRALKIANRALAPLGACVVDDMGNITAPENLKKEVTTSN